MKPSKVEIFDSRCAEDIDFEKGNYPLTTSKN